MANHSPLKCKICGEYHCLAGCVPIQECKDRADGKAYDKLAKQWGNIYKLPANTIGKAG